MAVTHPSHVANPGPVVKAWTGVRTRRADSWCYPLSSTCRACGRRVTCADSTADWTHE